MKSPDGSSLVREVESPDGPLCPVQHGGDCIALRRGTVQRFPDTDAINACGHLRRRETPPAGAVCIPATFLGEALGVLHVVADGRDDPRADDGLLVELSSLMAGRLGTLRAFDQESQNARTDPLTGLGNRRDFEARAAKVGSGDRKSTRLNSSHRNTSRMPSSA